MAAGKHKKWATKFDIPNLPPLNHESKVAAYRFVKGHKANWFSGRLRTPYITVYVNEQDGAGWTPYEKIDLREWGDSDE